MLVWLASYPRSGNHLLRMILRRCFDLGSFEIYQRSARSIDPALAAIVGERRFDEETSDDFLARARSSPELFLVKTHDVVPDRDHCIYIVRDARAALASYEKFLVEIVGRPRSFPDLIAGRGWPGSWQYHVGRFLSREPDNTLILRYEDLASGNPPLERIAEFLGVASGRPFDIPFQDLHALDGRTFGTGHNRPGIATIERDHHELFWQRCGKMMNALGYEAAGSADRELPVVAATPLFLIRQSRPEDDGTWMAVAGFDFVEGPFPEIGLSSPYRWTIARQASIDLFSFRSGRRTLSLAMCGMAQNQEVRISLDGAPPLRRTLRSDNAKLATVTIQHDFSAGACQLTIEVDRLDPSPDGRKLGLLLAEVRFDDHPAGRRLLRGLFGTLSWPSS